ncbi:MAG: phosphoadenosine phosphosulfate reductase family protein [Nitrospira sp.]|nr:phosphoadenosine phosphosulfate reductase family protein [Nitrospira sp.]
MRVHLLQDRTGLNIWEYLDPDRIPLPTLYFDQSNGLRHRSLGCVPCTGTVASRTSSIPQIISELHVTSIAEGSRRSHGAKAWAHVTPSYPCGRTHPTLRFMILAEWFAG